MFLNTQQDFLVFLPLFHLENFDLVTTIFYLLSKHQERNYRVFNCVHAWPLPLSFESYSTQPAAKSSSLSQNQSYCCCCSLASVIAATMGCYDSMIYVAAGEAIGQSGMRNQRRFHYFSASFWSSVCETLSSPGTLSVLSLRISPCWQHSLAKSWTFEMFLSNFVYLNPDPSTSSVSDMLRKVEV